MSSEGWLTVTAKLAADAPAKKKLSYKDQRELEGLPPLIQQLERSKKPLSKSSMTARSTHVTPNALRNSMLATASWRRA